MIRSLRYVALGVVLLSAACASTPGSSPPLSGAPRPLTLTPGAHVNIGIVTDHPGFSLVEQGNPSGNDGFDLQLADWLLRELKIEKENVPISLKERVSKLRQREVSPGGVSMVVATFSMTDDRRKLVDFVGPYLITKQGVMVRADNSTIKDVDDLKNTGKNVCTIAETTGNDKLKKAETSGSNIFVTTKPSLKDCMESLIDGDVEAVSTDQIVLYGFAQSKTYKDHVKVLSDISFGDEENYGIGIPNNSHADCEVIKEKLEKFLNDEWKSFFDDNFPDIPNSDYINYRPTKTDECENGT
ncbi:transporter substrate-binding domain-containing protein [Streptosporangium sp. NPDC006007]|uniref:transporter substrate-binding domain-containing protein n=1 Tax=Streptosporangium sp. NPDC006007 TaxID=3154575 RepID=UPI0033ACB6B5